ncbi:MAG: 16S rRNA (cytidine(1402)-2'-O)-methyltransferase [Desulfobacterales bacterium]
MKQKGKLYIVATPIGNMDDITIRAIRTLREVDTVAAEDTRLTARLLSHHQIDTPLISFHEHNESRRIALLTARMEAGESLALVSDAGTPSVSDPGFRLVRAAVEKEIQVVPIPGASAAITALCAAGLPTDSFTFVGFPPKKKGKRRELLENLKKEPRTLIFYESPLRISAFLSELKEILGERYAVLGRELTKLHEEFIRGNLSEILQNLENRAAVKGECTLLVSGAEEHESLCPENLAQEIEKGLEAGLSISDLSKSLAQTFGISRKEIYALALEVKGKND